MNDAHTPEMLDDVAVYALGTLPALDAARVRAHILSCAECRAEYDALAATAAGIGIAAETTGNAAVCPSTLLKPRIMRVVRADSNAPATPVTATPAVPAPRAVWPAYLAAAACLAIAAGSFASTLSLSSQLRDVRAQLSQARAGTAELEADVQTDRSTLADMTATTAKRFPAADGEIVTNGKRLYIALRDLPAPPKGKVYQAWTLPKGSKTMAPSSTFTPDSHGVALLALPVDARDTTVVAVSVEPAGGSRQPTSKPVVVVPLT